MADINGSPANSRNDSFNYDHSSSMGMGTPNDLNNDSSSNSRHGSCMVIISDHSESGDSFDGLVFEEDFSDESSNSFSDWGIGKSTSEVQLGNINFVPPRVIHDFLPFASLPPFIGVTS